MKTFVVLSLTLFCLITVPGFAENEISPSETDGNSDLGMSADAVLSLTQHADQLRNQGEYAAALELLRKGNDEHPSEAEILWRLARVKVNLGTLAETKDEQMRLFLKGEEDARAAAAADDENSEAHFALAVALGRVSLLSGNKKKVRLSREIKGLAERAIQLNPHHAGVYHLLGRWHYEAESLGFLARNFAKALYGGLPDSSYEEAERYFKKAIDLSDEIIHHLHLGKTYIVMGHKIRAKGALKRALAIRAVNPNDERRQEEARLLLGTLKQFQKWKGDRE